MSVSSTSPATLFGGTWERIQDRFLLAAGSSYAAGKTGGAATHKLTTNEMPSHTHTLKDTSNAKYHGFWTSDASDGSKWGIYSHGSTSSGRTGVLQNNNTGGGQAHNNMPPYIAVYVWKRTA